MTQITLPLIILLSLFGAGSMGDTASSALNEDSTTAKSRELVSTTPSTAPTTTIDCSDVPDVDCAKLLPQCSDYHYDELMDKYCRKTCNRCFVTPTCHDATDRCVEWNKNGFCNSTFYTPEVKKKYCEKTCGFCK
ncbi:unnamed protein product [Cylicocyclus nassatus]|uniref:ShKT domain-containing protein n=1 Tax=Cylicocyclus nassatus TaxID=53992 RepID=A0AA36M7F1_CYLNA|nr:unnamed protein product [Cylicocyclus nassatus]